MGLGVWAVKLGGAETAAYGVTREISSWQAKQLSPSLESWQRAHNDLETAQRLSRKNGAIEELIGVLYAERRRNADFQEIALEHFARSLALRPSSPYTWSNIADVRYRLGKTTGDFEQVVATAASLGPNEPEVQRVVVDLGLALWDEMGTETRALILQTLASGMRRNPMEMLQISVRRGRLDLACPRVPDTARFPDPKWAKLCEKNT